MSDYSDQGFTDPGRYTDPFGGTGRPPEWPQWPMQTKQTYLCQTYKRAGLIRAIFHHVGVEPEARVNTQRPRLTKRDLAAILAKFEEIIRIIRSQP